MSQLLRQTLGDFRLVREIGRGGMGIVFEAIELSLNRRVALKVLPPGIVRDEKASRRFKREAEALARLRHPSIVAIHAFGTDGDYHYIVLDYVEGRSLQSILDDIRRTPTTLLSTREVQRIIERREPAPGEEHAPGHETLDLGRGSASAPQSAARASSVEPREARHPAPAASSAAAAREVPGRPVIAIFVEMMEKIARALDYSHREGVIHRDVKPGNILVDRSGHPYLMDFGLALETGAGSITKTGELIGTPTYMSPEQLVSRRFQIDRRTDVYSLGVTLYEVLTSTPPFRGRTSQEIIRSVLMSEPERPRRRNPNLSADLETIVLKAMEKDPERRYQTAGDLADDLRRFLDYEPIHARPASLIQRWLRIVRRHREIAAAVLLAVVALGGGAGYQAKLSMDFARRVRETEESIRRERIVRVRSQTDAGEQEAAGAQRLFAQVEELRKVAEKAGPGDAFLEANRDLAEVAQKAREKAEAAVHRFSVALGIDPADARAGQDLADICQALCAYYEASWEFDKADLIVFNVRQYDFNQKHKIWLERKGTLEVETSPPGADVSVTALVPTLQGVIKLGQTVASFESNAGQNVKLEMGDYLVTIKKSGFAEARYPLRLMRNEPHRAKVRLFATADVPAGFIHVPAGDFMMGQIGNASNPWRRVTVGDFFISETEVTMEEYRAFIDDANPTDLESVVPRRSAKPPYYPYWKVDDEGHIGPLPQEVRKFPVFGINYKDAEQYCFWKRLHGVSQARIPTEEEWEKAARGVDGRTYPWGNFIQSSYCKILDSTDMRAEIPLSPVRSYPTDVSPYGVFDMAGSIAEWTSSHYDARPIFNVVRGSAYLGTVGAAAGYWRGFADPESVGDHLGFRVAATPPVR